MFILCRIAYFYPIILLFSSTTTRAFNPIAKMVLQLNDATYPLKEKDSVLFLDGDLEGIRLKLLNRNENHNPLSYSSLRVHSMRKNYSLELLKQFYNEHMIPHFPIEDERDSLEHFISCLDPKHKTTFQKKGDHLPITDILLLICDFPADSKGAASKKHQPIIFAGVAFEYFERAEVGLVSYVTVLSQYRKLGIMKILHSRAIQSLKDLHMECHYQKHRFLFHDHTTSIKAIFAETNTVDAKDGTTEKEAKNRHHALFRLGYRLIECPYSQPPLAIDKGAYDDVMLLIYQGDEISGTRSMGFGGWIPSKISHAFLVDYLKSGAEGGSESSVEKKKESLTLETHRCFKLSEWFAKKNSHARIKPNLPWIDVTKKCEEAFMAESGPLSA